MTNQIFSILCGAIINSSNKYGLFLNERRFFNEIEPIKQKNTELECNAFIADLLIKFWFINTMKISI